MPGSRNALPSGSTRNACRSPSGGQTSPASTCVTSWAALLFTCTGSDALDLVERDPAALAGGSLEGVDGPLHQRALAEVALVLRLARQDLVGEVLHQVG